MIALIIDILGVLIMETGMSLEMSNLGNNLVLNYSLGIAVGVLGMIGIILAYPVYNRITPKNVSELRPKPSG